jgi:glycerophosphoryl diester phosphodiesterase
MVISEGRGSKTSLHRQLVACEAHGLSVNFRAVHAADYVTFFQSAGFPVWCWTVNDGRVARRLMRWGVDGLIGDNPALLRRLI